jgi:hypothetical protein
MTLGSIMRGLAEQIFTVPLRPDEEELVREHVKEVQQIFHRASATSTAA